MEVLCIVAEHSVEHSPAEILVEPCLHHFTGVLCVDAAYGRAASLLSSVECYSYEWLPDLLTCEDIL